MGGSCSASNFASTGDFRGKLTVKWFWLICKTLRAHGRRLRRPPMHSRWRRPASPFQRLGETCLVSRSGGRLSHLHLVRSRQLHRPEVDGQLVDRAVECKWHLVVLVV